MPRSVHAYKVTHALDTILRYNEPVTKSLKGNNNHNTIVSLTYILYNGGWSEKKKKQASKSLAKRGANIAATAHDSDVTKNYIVSVSEERYKT